MLVLCYFFKRVFLCSGMDLTLIIFTHEAPEVTNMAQCRQYQCWLMHLSPTLWYIITKCVMYLSFYDCE